MRQEFASYEITTNPAYAVAINAAHAKGIQVLGLVKFLGTTSTNQAPRDYDNIFEEVRKWYSCYPQLDGFYFDNQPTDDAHVTDCKNLFDKVRSLNRTRPLIIVSAPRTPCVEGYLKLAKPNILCTNYSSENPESFTPSVWIYKYDRRQFSTVLFGVNANDPASLPNFIRSAAEKHFGWIFATTQADYNPGHWQSLPSTWDRSVQVMQAMNMAIKGNDQNGGNRSGSSNKNKNANSNTKKKSATKK
jgi:hypothetical protein